MFQLERRPEIKKTNPDLPFQEVTKVVGNEWSSMAPEQKKVRLVHFVDEMF